MPDEQPAIGFSYADFVGQYASSFKLTSVLSEAQLRHILFQPEQLTLLDVSNRFPLQSAVYNLHSHDAMIYSELSPSSFRQKLLSLRLRKGLHGNGICIHGKGVLLLGETNSGKSEVSLQLLERGHQLIADDLIIVEREGTNLTLTHAEGNSTGQLHHNELGLIDIARTFGSESISAGCQLDLVVRLTLANQPQHVTLAGTRSDMPVLGLSKPLYKLAAHPGRCMSTLIETAIKLI